MTKQELNRDIKRLKSEIYRMSFDDQKSYFDYIDNQAKKEFTRLFWADKEFEYMNRTSILIMLRLNIRFRIIALQTFGLNIELNEL